MLRSLCFIAAVFAATTACAQPAGGRSGMRQACNADIAKLCGDVERGGGRIGQCLKAHQDEVSEGCKTAIVQARAAHKQARSAPPAS